MSDFDARMMARTLELAARGLGRVEPNPAVGAVVVSDETVVGEGYHQFFGGPHAEVNALRVAGERARGATMYVTLEPCCHYGKTPPCTDAVISAGIRRVVVAMQDPFEKVAGRGLAQLREAGIRVEVGLCETAARKLNAPYLKLHTSGLPFFTAKWAMTLDGKIATDTGDSMWISSEESREMVHRMRDRADAAMIGVQTALRDDPLLTCWLPGGRSPRRIVVDSKARLPLGSRLVASVSEAPLWVACGRSAPRERVKALADAGCLVIPLSERADRVDLAALASMLGKESLTNVLVEGGSELLGSLFEARLADRVTVFVAPKLLGGKQALTAVGGIGVRSVSQAWTVCDMSVTRIGKDVMIEGDVRYGEETGV
jgi:diaminohydroxyphosphoribosylaminopyrimidine deaminase/5-amino-6-(5-phosphoribosylamino)uracil reductase